MPFALTAPEIKATFQLASVFALRLLAVFMILPVLTPYAMSLSGSNATLMGLTVGIYGLTQALLQAVFGYYSDRFGRKRLIVLGLILFVIGSLIAALSTSIYSLLVGRALQGAAAIGSVLLAFLSDRVAPERRGQAMAIVGITIGLSFALSFVLGPLLAAFWSVREVFGASAVLGLLGIVVIYKTQSVPVSDISLTQNPHRAVFKTLLTHPQLWRLDVGVFVLHATLTALFVVLPLLLFQVVHLNLHDQWKFYLPVIAIAFAIALPAIRMSEARDKVKSVILSAIVLLSLSLIGFLLLPLNAFTASVLLVLFLTAFTILEALLPARISHVAPPSYKGTALGIYSTLQFAGIFVGGTLGGLMLHIGPPALFLFSLSLVAIWFLVAVSE